MTKIIHKCGNGIKRIKDGRFKGRYQIEVPLDDGTYVYYYEKTRKKAEKKACGLKNVYG